MRTLLPGPQATAQRRRRRHCGSSSCPVAAVAEAPPAAPPSEAASSCSDASGFAAFSSAVAGGANLVPLVARLFSDHLTPVLAYRCLVRQDDREAPSFLLESVVNGDQSVRASRDAEAAVRCEFAHAFSGCLPS